LSLNFGGRTPAIAGTVVWSELSNSHHLVADASTITTLRTGAVVGVATELLAPAEARTCAMIGAGGQAKDQVRAVHTVRPLASVIVVDRNQYRAESVALTLRDELEIPHVAVSGDADEAVQGIDIICCATTATAPLFSLDSVDPHAHINAIGAFRPTMRELPDELLADATVVIDEKEAILEESGEVIHAIAAGVITENDLIELGAALSSGTPQTGGRTVFKSVGVAMQDWAIARLLAQRCHAGQPGREWDT
jgi:ornithine cyclodeaminase